MVGVAIWKDIKQLDLGPVADSPPSEMKALNWIFETYEKGTIPQPQLVLEISVVGGKPIPQLDHRPIACSSAVEVHYLTAVFISNNHKQSHFDFGLR